MRGIDHGAARLRALGQQALQELLRGDIQPVQRLVQEQDLRIVLKRRDQEKLLLHPLGVFADRTKKIVREIERLRQRETALLGGDGRNLVEIGHQRQKLEARQDLVQLRSLGHVADDAAHGICLEDHVESGDRRRSGGRLQEGREHLQCRGLSGAVRAEQSEDLPRRHRQRQAVDRLAAAVGAGESVKLDHGGRVYDRSASGNPRLAVLFGRKGT